MRRPSRPGLSLVLSFFIAIPLTAQDLASIGTEKPFSFSGGFSFNQIFHASRGMASRRDPYRYIAAANLNLSLYGWSVPIAFTVSNHTTAFAQPFNQYAVHPSWKWINAHAGYTSMSFSPYTVNGHQFLGGAIALTPGDKWRFSALYGRFLKAVPYDTSAHSTHLPAFRRMGYGFKASYGTGSDFVDLIFFHAADEPQSISTVPDSIGVAPEENAVLSIAAGKMIAKHFHLRAELATSALTRDMRAAPTKSAHLLARWGRLFTSRMSSAYYQAYKTSFDYQGAGWLLGVAYEHIDPGYRTLGAYYFNSDLENVTVNGSAGMLQGKLSMAMSVGVQRDNLADEKVRTMRRVVSAFTVNYMPGEKFNLSASYSGFQSYTNMRSQFEAINRLTPYPDADTLDFTQISRNASLSGMYTLRQGTDSRQHLGIQVSWQDAAQQQGGGNEGTGTRFYNLNSSYTIGLVPQHTTVALAFNATINEGPVFHTRTLGPTVSLTRSFLQRKFRSTLSSSYNHTYDRGVRRNIIFSCRWNGALSIKGNHKVQASAVVVRRQMAAETAQPKVTEFTATAGYSYVLNMHRR